MTLQIARQPLSLVAPSPCVSAGPMTLLKSSFPGPLCLQTGTWAKSRIIGPVRRRCPHPRAAHAPPEQAIADHDHRCTDRGPEESRFTRDKQAEHGTRDRAAHQSDPRPVVAQLLTAPTNSVEQRRSTRETRRFPR